MKQGIIIIISLYPENGWMGDSTEGQDNQGVGGQEGGLPVHLQQGRCQGKVVLQGRGNQPKWEYRDSSLTGHKEKMNNVHLNNL